MEGQQPEVPAHNPFADPYQLAQYQFTMLLQLQERQIALGERQLAASSNQAREKKLEAIKLPTFDGKNPLEVFTWVQSVETAFQAADSLAWLGTSRATAKVSASLKGVALAWFNLSSGKYLALDWWHFKQELFKKYGLQEKDNIAAASLLELCKSESHNYDLFVNQYNMLLTMVTNDDSLLTEFENTLLFQAFKKGMPQCLTQVACLYKGRQVLELQEHLVWHMSRDPDLAKRAGYATGANGVIPTPMELGLTSRAQSNNVQVNNAAVVDDEDLPIDPLELQGYVWDGHSYRDSFGGVYENESALYQVGAVFNRGNTRFNRGSRFRNLRGRSRGGFNNRGGRSGRGRSGNQPMDWTPSYSRGGRSGGGFPSRNDSNGQGSRGVVRGNCNACGNPGHYARDCEAVKKGLIHYPSRSGGGGGGYRGGYRGGRGGRRGMYTTHVEGEGGYDDEGYGYTDPEPAQYQMTHVSTASVQAGTQPPPPPTRQHF